MTVQELIEILETLPKNAEVLHYENDPYNNVYYNMISLEKSNVSYEDTDNTVLIG